MKDHSLFDKRDLHLIRVLHTLLIERSVSNAAIRLGTQQPKVNASLKRLCDVAGDALLVCAAGEMVPTDAAQRMVAPATSILQAATLFLDTQCFAPTTISHTFRVDASNYLAPFFTASGDGN